MKEEVKLHFFSSPAPIDIYAKHFLGIECYNLTISFNSPIVKLTYE